MKPLEIHFIEEEIRKAQERLSITDSLSLPLFTPKPGSNKIVKIEPFFYLPVDAAQQIRSDFIPYILTLDRAQLWIHQYVKKNSHKDTEITKSHIKNFRNALKKMILQTRGKPRNHLFHLKEELEKSLSSPDFPASMTQALITFLEEKHVVLHLDAPVYYEREELLKKGGSAQDLPEFFQDSQNPFNLTPYHYSLDLLLLNKSHFNLWKILKKLKSTYAKGKQIEFIFKTGPENAREKLILELARPLVLDKYLMPKTEITIKGVKIEDDSDPTGLICRFVKNEADTLWHKNIRRYMDCKQHSLKADFLAHKETKSKRYKERLKKLAKKITALNLQESVEGNLLLDLIFGSYDSHFSQYKVQNGVLVNIDFSRFGIPCETYAIQERTYATLCSSLLDNPYIHTPLHKTIRTLIDKWDIPHFIDESLSHVGEISAFETATKQMRALKTAMEALVVADDSRIHFKYFMHFGQAPQHLSTLQQKKLIGLKLSHESKLLKKELFQKLHPSSFSAIINRLKMIQESVRTQSEITMFDLFSKLYPGFVPFIRVLQGLVPSAGLGLAFRPGRRSLERISLEEIASASAIKLEQKEQLPYLRAHITEIRQNSMSWSTLSFMGEIYF